MAAIYPALLSLLLVALTLTSYHRYSSYERATSSVSKTREEKNLTVYAMAVGQGDGNIILCPNGRDLIIVDMGAKISIFANGDYGKYLLKEKFKVLENQIDIHIVITHPDEDHYNLLMTAFDGDLLNRVKEIIVGSSISGYGKKFKSWMNNTPNLPPVYTINQGRECFGNSECTLTPEWVGLDRYRSMLEAAAMHYQRGDHHHAWASQYRSDPWQFCGGDVNITVLGANICIPSKYIPDHCIRDSKNARSVIMKLKYKNWSLFLSGDFEGVDQQEKLIKQWPHNIMPSIFQSTYYKISHHGAWSPAGAKPNMEELLQEIHPKRAYVSSAHPLVSPYSHPKCEVFDYLIHPKQLGSIDTTDTRNGVDCCEKSVNKSKRCYVADRKLGYAIYETCHYYDYISRCQVCQDIEITTDGYSDYTAYRSVPDNFVNPNPKNCQKPHIPV